MSRAIWNTYVPFPVVPKRERPPVPSIWDIDYDGAIEIVKLKDLWALQEGVGLPAKRRRHFLPPLVSFYQGRLMIRDGHHRLTKLMLAGRRTARVLVLRPA